MTQVLRRTAELANGAAGFSDGICAVQAYLASVFQWEVRGYRLFVDAMQEAEGNMAFLASALDADVSAGPLVLLRIEAGERLLALIAFCPGSDAVSWEQRAILAEVADQLATLAQRGGFRQSTLRHAIDLLHQGQLSGMAEVAQGLSHELSQPLAAVAAYAGAMRRRLSNERAGDADISYLGERLLEQVERAGGILQSAKDFLLQHSCATNAVDVGKSLQHLVDYAQQSLRMAAVKLEVDIAPELPLARGSEAQLAQIVLCLLANAIGVSTAAGGGIAIRAAQVDSEVWISVSNGCAQPLSAGLEAGFSPFYAVADSGKRGLAICRSLVEAQGGKLWSRHLDDETILTVALPAAH
jgi:C4-dicarboxylate-specific signal transduction histidine kinase